MDATAATNQAVKTAAFALALAALHLAAVAVDFVDGVFKAEVSFPFTLALLHADAAMWCVHVSRQPKLLSLGFRLSVIVGGLTALGILCTWQDQDAEWVRLFEVLTNSFAGQCALTTLLNLPLIAAALWIHTHGEPRDWKWIAFASILLSSVGLCWLSSTTYDFVTTRSRSWWLEMESLYFYHTLFAGVLSLASVVLAACVISYPRRWIHIALALALLLSFELPIMASRAAVLSNPRYSYGYGAFFGPGAFQTAVVPFSWQMFWDFNIPFVAAFAGLLLSPFFLAINRAVHPSASPFTTIECPIVLSLDERRHRFWRLTSFALGLSSLNLLCGFALYLSRVDNHDEHGSQGILIELLFLAPLGLWAAQTGASALFLQSKVWNISKRLLVVLAWAELSMLAFWGQIALSNSIHWKPSDYVGEVLHVFTGAILLAGLGALINYFRSERMYCPELELIVPPSANAKWFSLSLADIICVVTASAALVYPFSVIFTLERWTSPFVVCFSFLKTAGWPLAAGALSYFILRSYLTREKSDYWMLSGAAICLLACCGYDYPALHQFADEYFFGVRSSLRFTALPALFIAVAIAAIGLSRCKFQVVHKSSIPISVASPTPTSVPAIEPTPRPIIFLGTKPEPVSSKAQSPWD